MNVDSGSMVVSLPFGKLTNFLVNYRSRLMADLALDGCLQGNSQNSKQGRKGLFGSAATDDELILAPPLLGSQKHQQFSYSIQVNLC